MGGSSCPLGLFCTQKARIIVLTWYRQLVHPAHPPVTTRVTLLVANRVAGPCTTSRRSFVKHATGVRKIDKYTTKRHPCLPILITLQIISRQKDASISDDRALFIFTGPPKLYDGSLKALWNKVAEAQRVIKMQHTPIYDRSVDIRLHMFVVSVQCACTRELAFTS